MVLIQLLLPTSGATPADGLVPLAQTRRDLATADGVDQLWAATGGKPVDALLANAGHGLGHAFLDQDFEEVRHGVVRT